ncbi:hypothetical protein [Falsiroseomonas sp. CW058]|uniref:hypothetical protein n=1 Tax=Falsiroseomonas sp. CW058 TaxID=3388664 RepID=UPI003D322553
MAAPTPNAAADPGLADSIFTFTFTATSGDAWGGWFVADSAAFAAGFVLTTAAGRYAVTAEQEAGLDLGPQGLEERQVFVEWYRDAGSGLFLPTRNGAATAAGLAGLGSERDAAWTGLGWDGFGAGGADQADAASIPADSLFTWSFTARSGDRWTGVLYDAAAAFQPGDTVPTAEGSYRILDERRIAGGEETAERGTVRLTGGYFDAASGTTLAVQDADAAVDAGAGGLGSETGAAWTGEGWVAFGAGGAFQADADRDASYYWTYWHPWTGDAYGGWLIDDAGRYAADQRIPANGGEYRIWSATPLDGSSGFADGTMWMTFYYDAGSGRWLEPLAWASGQQPLPMRGLGLEADWIWDGDNHDWAGRGETWWVTVEQDSVYRWSFWSPQTGDAYGGTLVADAGAYSPGDTVWANGVPYRIEAEEELGRRADDPWGTVRIDYYYDGGSGRWLWNATRDTGAPVTRDGLGTETDWVWAGDGWDWFGRGETWWVTFEQDSLYRWSFWSPQTGDAYGGTLVADARAYTPGDTVWANGVPYRIEAEEELGRRADDPWGTVRIDYYYDGGSGRWLWNATRDSATPATRDGLGAETDWVWDGDNWDWFGRGQTWWAGVE